MNIEYWIMTAMIGVIGFAVKFWHSAVQEKQKIIREYAKEELQEMRDGFTKTQDSIIQLSTKIDGLATRDYVDSVKTEMRVEMKSDREVMNEKLKHAEHVYSESVAEHRAGKRRTEEMFEKLLDVEKSRQKNEE